jgi:hypothetical protein
VGVVGVEKLERGEEVVGLFSYQFAELLEASWELESCFRSPGSYMPTPETVPRLLGSLQTVDFLLC